LYPNTRSIYNQIRHRVQTEWRRATTAARTNASFVARQPPTARRAEPDVNQSRRY
jgi:hypothetical protein